MAAEREGLKTDPGTQELRRELSLRRSLLDIGTRLSAVSAGTSSEDIFQLVSEGLHAVVPIKALTVYVTDPAAPAARPIWHSLDDPDTEAILSFEVPFGTGATGSAALQRQSILSNIGQDDRQKVDVPETDPAVDEHLLAVPVLVEEQTRAVLTMRRTAAEPPFTPEDARLAELFAQHMAAVFLLNELAESRRLLAAQVEQLKELNRLKDEFVANVSHELRTPISAIIGSVMTVAGSGDMLASEDRRELLIRAERQAKRLAELLENLLAESRLTGGNPALVPARLDVQPFLEEIAETLRSRSQDRLVLTNSVGRPWIVTDRTLVYRILFNLGDNALKYSDGPVRLEARWEDQGVGIDVIDQGVGIAAEDIPRIFEQFRQLDGSSRRGVGGVGLGLHLCARAAEALGGRIRVQSDPGNGSTFTLWLPAQAPAR